MTYDPDCRSGKPISGASASDVATTWLEHREREVARALAYLQRAAYRYESRLLGDDRIPQLHETPEDIAALKLRFIGTHRKGCLVAAVAYGPVESGVLDIDRLMVHPLLFRQGLARGLVSYLLMTVPHEVALVSTGRQNHPARALYSKLGFVHRRDREIVPRLIVSEYERVHDRGTAHGWVARPSRT